MKKTVFFGAIAALLALGPTSANSASLENFKIETAFDLAALCGANSEDPLYLPAIHLCQGYLIGVHDAHSAVAAALDEAVYCFPTENPPTRDEAAEAIATYLTNNPAAADMTALDAFLEWAAKVYPCK